MQKTGEPFTGTLKPDLWDAAANAFDKKAFIHLDQPTFWEDSTGKRHRDLYVPFNQLVTPGLKPDDKVSGIFAKITNPSEPKREFRAANVVKLVDSSTNTAAAATPVAVRGNLDKPYILEMSFTPVETDEWDAQAEVEGPDNNPLEGILVKLRYGADGSARLVTDSDGCKVERIRVPDDVYANVRVNAALSVHNIALAGPPKPEPPKGIWETYNNWVLVGAFVLVLIFSAIFAGATIYSAYSWYTTPVVVSSSRSSPRKPWEPLPSRHNQPNAPAEEWVSTRSTAPGLSLFQWFIILFVWIIAIAGLIILVPFTIYDEVWDVAVGLVGKAATAAGIVHKRQPFTVKVEIKPTKDGKNNVETYFDGKPAKDLLDKIPELAQKTIMSPLIKTALSEFKWNFIWDVVKRVLRMK